tara:strand:+ start:1377 stop:2456 length:1080 start_codon:yes stop_codon:yes gene_type:complete
MKIKVDNKIPYVDYFTEGLNIDISFFDDQTFKLDSLSEDSIVVIRSTYKTHGLNIPGFLKLLCSVSAGEDHVDKDFLNKKRIDYSFSTGANSCAVAEYFFSCLALLLKKRDFVFEKDKVLVVGNGNIGERIYRTLKEFNFNVDVYDPFKESTIKNLNYIGDYKVISLHIPLNNNTPHPTKYLIDKSFLEKMSNNSWIINTSRGGVVNEEDFMSQNKVSIIADVFNNEPNINKNFHEFSYISTPHIAGHTQFARYQMTKMAFEKIFAFLKLDTQISKDLDSHEVKPLDIRQLESDFNKYGFPVGLILETYDPTLDNFNHAEFKKFRDNYHNRLGFAQRKILIDDDHYNSLIKKIGFSVIQ